MDAFESSEGHIIPLFTNIISFWPYPSPSPLASSSFPPSTPPFCCFEGIELRTALPLPKLAQQLLSLSLFLKILWQLGLEEVETLQEARLLEAQQEFALGCGQGCTYFQRRLPKLELIPWAFPLIFEPIIWEAPLWEVPLLGVPLWALLLLFSLILSTLMVFLQPEEFLNP